MKATLLILVAAVLVGIASYFAASQQSAAVLSALRASHDAELATLQAQLDAAKQQLAASQRNRDKLKVDAAEVHKLRGEISTLRKANETLEKSAAALAQQAKAQSKQSAEISVVEKPIPASFQNYSEMAQFAATLRTKGRNGQLSPEEQAWLKQMKPELDKLESNPHNFAEFQAALIQNTVGITDPQKLQQIRNTIQRVSEAAVTRGLDIPSRPQDDAAWVQQRHQIDRRGTTAIQNLLDENERAAFDRSFLGIMGVDLGTGVDKTLYPPGFLVEAPQPRQ